MEKIDSLSVEVQDDLIVVMQHSPEFCAIYALAPDEPQLKLQTKRSWPKLRRWLTTRLASWDGLARLALIASRLSSRSCIGSVASPEGCDGSSRIGFRKFGIV
jgi:hypothetical protein